MAHRLDASFQMLLSDNPKEMAEGLAEVAKAWTAFTSAIEQYQGEFRFSITEVRTSTRINKRGRKAKLTTVPPLGTGHDQSAA